jgi:KDO2-lipid IV(A) lauroyltransferase
MKYFVERALIWIIGGIFYTLPRQAGLYLGKMIGRLGYYLASKRRKLAITNLKMSLGGELKEEQIREIARDSFEFLGMNAAEFFKLPMLNISNIGRYTSVEGEENLIDALNVGKGVLSLSGHIGNWDMLSAGLALRGYPVSLITKVSRSKALNRIWMENRRKAGIGLLMGRGTVKESLHQLRNKGIVGFAMDQNARRKEGIFVPFFGREACTISSLALLARRTEAPVVPIYSYREGDMHRIVIEKAMRHDNLEDADTDILVRTRAYTEWIEKVVRRHPGQWTWLHDRWKTRPKEELT